MEGAAEGPAGISDPWVLWAVPDSPGGARGGQCQLTKGFSDLGRGAEGLGSHGAGSVGPTPRPLAEGGCGTGSVGQGSHLVAEGGAQVVVDHLLVEDGCEAAREGGHDPGPVRGTPPPRPPLRHQMLHEGLGGCVVVHDGHLGHLRGQGAMGTWAACGGVGVPMARQCGAPSTGGPGTESVPVGGSQQRGGPGTGGPTWKLCSTATFTSTAARSFQREELVPVSSPMRWATSCGGQQDRVGQGGQPGVPEGSRMGS